MAAVPSQSSTVLLDDGSPPAAALRAAVAGRTLDTVRDGEADHWARLTRARCVLLPMESLDAGVDLLRRLRVEGLLGAAVFYAERPPEAAVRAALLAGAEDVLDPDCQEAPELRRAMSRAIERHEACAQAPPALEPPESAAAGERAMRDLRHEREFSTALLGAVRDGYMYTRNGVISEVNDELCHVTGFAREELVGRRSPYPFCPPEDPAAALELLGDEHGIDTELILVRGSGQRFEAAVSSRPSLDAHGRITGHVVTVRDVSAERRHQRQLARVAERDVLTDLLNHRAFHQRLRTEVKRAERHSRPLSLALLDVDHLGRVNDVHGHFAGDGVILEITRRLSERAREGEPIGRVGGEEFAWILPETPLDGAHAAAEAALRTIADTPCGVAGAVTVSVGVATLDDARGEKELFRIALRALGRAKATGGNAVVAHGSVAAAAS